MGYGCPKTPAGQRGGASKRVSGPGSRAASGLAQAVKAAVGVAACFAVLLGLNGCGKDVPFISKIKIELPRRVKIKSVADALQAARNQNDPTLRYRAYVYLGDPSRYDNAETIEEIVQVLAAAYKAEQDEQIRIAIIDSLGRLGSTAALPTLTEAARNPSVSIRVAACQALGRLGTVDALPTLDERFSTDSSLDVRLAAAAALANIPSRNAAVVLVQGLTDPDVAIVYRCRRSLQQMLGADYGSDVSAWRDAVRQADFSQVRQNRSSIRWPLWLFNR